MLRSHPGGGFNPGREVIFSNARCNVSALETLLKPIRGTRPFFYKLQILSSLPDFTIRFVELRISIPFTKRLCPMWSAVRFLAHPGGRFDSRRELNFLCCYSVSTLID
ncbi:hypothetical protein AVEN_137656-1 [Araneus ventricosus]|uniref:Uncharacterized protein n=1 Tax=Araneus ventricosus TaxID=182803 RepID=A0A4Y2RXZ5_ARAVE|nr:hypothetical protein AVEN_137656-1 [Araneus ventricosus]